jgi:hypothetical protein
MSVPGYWRKVLSGAWDKTCRPLDWNAEKAAVVLVAVGTIILAGVHLGPAAMFASAIGYLWILAPLAFAALVLFIWGCFQTTAELYAELSTASRTTIAELEAALCGVPKAAARLRGMAACRSSDIAGGGVSVVRLVAGPINPAAGARLVQCF